jgi:hypothetical protein
VGAPFDRLAAELPLPGGRRGVALAGEPGNVICFSFNSFNPFNPFNSFGCGSAALPLGVFALTAGFRINGAFRHESRLTEYGTLPPAKNAQLFPLAGFDSHKRERLAGHIPARTVLPGGIEYGDSLYVG